MKILFTDLDDTLLKDDKSVHPRNITAISKALAQGDKIVICTGRPTGSAMEIAHNIGLDLPGCYVISYVGAAIYDYSNEKFILHKGLNLDQVDYLLEEGEKYGLHAHACSGNEIWEIVLDELGESYAKRRNMDIKKISNVDREHKVVIEKVILAADKWESLFEFKEKHKTWLKENCNCVYSVDTYLECLHLDVSKGAALKFIAEKLKVPIENTIAIGDHDNDVSMIKAAGLGVAMVNGQDYAKNVAAVITTATNNNGGVGEIIEKYMLKGN